MTSASGKPEIFWCELNPVKLAGMFHGDAAGAARFQERRYGPKSGVRISRTASAGPFVLIDGW
jgi:hypothetical protein